MAGNVRALRAIARCGRIMAVVKANAYGHGALPVAEAAVEAGAEWLGVYTVHEGVVLRQGGIMARILVFGPFSPAEVPAIWSWRLTPTVTSVAAAEALQRGAAGKRLPIHIKLDTGLHRAGVAAQDAVPFMERITGFPGLDPEGLYTHFACADEPDQGETQEQLAIFARARRELAQAGVEVRLHHAANSAATLNMPESHLDMVRCGISIYGYYPSPSVARSAPLRPALRWRSEVSRVHDVAPGEGVGYGHDFRARNGTRIALVPVGYGDGLPRCLGNGAGTIIIRGHHAPIVGRVSMDQITVNATDLPEIEPGDEAIILGEQGPATQTANDLAGQAGTISYEILTRLLPRVPRYYFRAGRLVGVMDLHSQPGPGDEVDDAVRAVGRECRPPQDEGMAGTTAGQEQG